jgi:hypothetical protein
VTDSYLACQLIEREREACLEKLLGVAEDGRETASNRDDALIGARNLVIDVSEKVKRATFERSKAFVSGARDGSHLDELTGPAHPLSAFKINMGSSSLRRSGLRLAQASAATPDDQAWVRDHAIGLLRSDNSSDVHAAALTLDQLSAEVTNEIDASLLSSHDHPTVRQLSAALCLYQPDRYRDTAMQLAQDRDYRVRRTLAQAAARTQPPRPEATEEILAVLFRDPRHSVRAATVASDRRSSRPAHA